MRAARLALPLFAACAHAEEPGSRALLELERLSFVPAAACTLLPNSDLTLRRPVVMDRFEFSRADLRHYWPERTPRAYTLPWSSEAAVDAPERADWPAFLDFHEAGELAALRGMRLPTPTEWLHVAVGRLGYQKPWGGPGREFFANTVVLDPGGQDFSLKAPCSVGTYENGKSRPFGCYDMLGNVWEWVDGIVLGCEPPPGLEDEYDELDDGCGTMASVMGGAFDTLWRPTFELDRVVNRQRFHARRMDKRTLSPSIGARMCAEAEVYLWSSAAHWGAGDAAEARVRDVGRRWAEEDALARSALRALLAELCARPDAPAGLAWLLEGARAEP